MSYYSDNNVKTKYLDPRVFVAGKRAVFDLDLTEAGYMPNIKLGLLGVTSSIAYTYNQLCGVAAMVRSARLLDGKTVLSQLNAAQFYKGFLNQNKPNAHAEVRTSNVELSSNGRTVFGLKDEVSRVAVEGLANINDITNQATPTNLGTLDMRDFFPILNALPMLPTSVFKNLRIELEFVATPNSQIINGNDSVLVQPRPILMVDCLINEDTLNKMMASMPSQIVWKEIEHDQFIIPQAVAGVGGGDGTVQRVDIKLNGFNNKIVDELLIVKEIGDAALEISGSGVLGLGKYSSQACYNQTCQFRVNGRNILPREGITGDNERLGFVVDTYGECCGYPGSNAYQAATDNLTQDGVNGSGQLDYIGVYLGKQINDLQVNYSRTNVTQTAGKRATNALLIGHVYGSVRKQMNMVGGGEYIVDYQQM